MHETDDSDRGTGRSIFSDGRRGRGVVSLGLVFALVAVGAIAAVGPAAGTSLVDTPPSTDATFASPPPEALGNDTGTASQQRRTASENQTATATAAATGNQTATAAATATENHTATATATATPDQREQSRRTAGNPSDVVDEITLITGDTVLVVERDNETRYRMTGGPAQTLEVWSGTYLFPRGVDYSTFHRELFNVERLHDEGQSDEETSTIPVIVTFDRYDGGELPDNLSAHLNVDNRLESLDAVGGSVDKDEAAAAYEALASSDRVETVRYDARVFAL